MQVLEKGRASCSSESSCALGEVLVKSGSPGSLELIVSFTPYSFIEEERFYYIPFCTVFTESLLLGVRGEELASFS